LGIGGQVQHFAYQPKCLQHHPTIGVKLNGCEIEHFEDLHCHLVKRKL